MADGGSDRFTINLYDMYGNLSMTIHPRTATEKVLVADWKAAPFLPPKNLTLSMTKDCKVGPETRITWNLQPFYSDEYPRVTAEGGAGTMMGRYIDGTPLGPHMCRPKVFPDGSIAGVWNINDIGDASLVTAGDAVSAAAAK